MTGPSPVLRNALVLKINSRSMSIFLEKYIVIGLNTYQANILVRSIALLSLPCMSGLSIAIKTPLS